MAGLQREGKVRWIGVSNFNVAQMERAAKIAPITSLQPPYSMLNRVAEDEILPFCKSHGRRNAKNYQEPSLSRNLAVADLLKTIGARHNVTAGVIAIAWTLHNPAITAAIVGGRSAKQVDGVFPASTFRLTETEYTEINAFLAAHP
jgi:aryl-alcohol dehydrogenase-like predicted oxidoreductase